MARIVARSWFQIHLFMTICIKKAMLNLKNTVNIFAGHYTQHQPHTQQV